MASEKDVVKAQNAAAQAATQARNEQQALDYFNAMDNFYLRQYSDEVNKTLRDQIQADQYTDALKIADMQRDAQLRAFDQSEQRYLDQLEFNQKEFEAAKAGINTRYDETLRSYDDKLTDQQRAYDQEVAQGYFDQQSIQRKQDQLEAELGPGGFQARQDALSLNKARDQLKLRADQRQASLDRQRGLLTEERADITSQQNEIRNLRVQADAMRQNREFAADLEETRAQINRDSQLANLAFDRQGQRIETLQRVGQAKAMGRKGVSATRTLQTTLALSGLNAARLTNQAFFAQKEFESTQDAVANRKAAIGIEDQMSRIREGTALERLSTQNRRLTIQDSFDTATRQAEIDADARTASALDTEQSLLSDILGKNYSNQAADYQQKLDQISYALGLSAEQLEMNKGRLADSIVSAAASLDSQLLQLEQSKFKADYNAHAARMLPPEFGPDPRPPYDVPLPEYVEPRPGAAPAPAYQAQYVAPQQPSGLATGLAIGGAALGIAATPFTLGASALAGASAGATGLFGMTAGALGATGAALGGAGAAASQAAGLMYKY